MHRAVKENRASDIDFPRSNLRPTSLDFLVLQSFLDLG